MTMTFSTPKQINAYQALVVAKALELYAKHKIRVNRAYTPKNMMATASNITGKKYKARAYLEAASDLRALVS